MKHQKFIISCSYQWSLENEKNIISEQAIKKVVEATKKRFNNKKHTTSIPYVIEFKRLRGSAGRFLPDNFHKRIKESNVIIIDITHPNPNVMIEFGMAYAIQKDIKPELSIYLISKDKINLPSNMAGYYVSIYKQEKGKLTFKDQNSLIMSIASDVIDFYNRENIGFVVDEIGNNNF